jgi:hypothetical protein
MKQPHHTLNTLNNNQHLVVAFNVDLPPEVEILSYGVPRLSIDGVTEVSAVLVPAPTEGPGRFALDFVPAFNLAFGHYAVEVEIDVVLATEGEVTLDRHIHFFVLNPEGDAIAVTPQTPVDQDAAMQAASAPTSTAIEEVPAGAGSGVPGPAAPLAPVEQPAPQAPEPLTDEQRAAAAAVAEQAALNQAAGDQSGEQPPVPLTDAEKALDAAKQSAAQQALVNQGASGEQPQI